MPSRTFDYWWQGHKDFSSQVSDLYSNSEQLHGSFQCYHFDCQNYLYGFANADDLASHLQLHGNPGHKTPEAYNSAFSDGHHVALEDSSPRRPSTMSVRQEAPPAAVNPRSYRTSSLTKSMFNPTLPMGPDQSIRSPGAPLAALPSQLESSPRTQTLTTLGKRSRPDLETNANEPCLRCKILKKGVSGYIFVMKNQLIVSSAMTVTNVQVVQSVVWKLLILGKL
jgi:hypothetical protein